MQLNKRELEAKLISCKKKRTILIVISSIIAGAGIVLFIFGLSYSMQNYSQFSDIKPENLVLVMSGSLAMAFGFVVLVLSLSIYNSQIAMLKRLIKDNGVYQENEFNIFGMFPLNEQAQSEANTQIEEKPNDNYPPILNQYEELMKQGIITKEEFEQKKKEYLDK